VASGRFDSTMSLAGHGSLCDGSTHDSSIGSNGNGRSGEHIAHQDTVGTHGKSGTENPKDVVVPGAIQKHNLLLALVVRVEPALKINTALGSPQRRDRPQDWPKLRC
jgi:hypothetical protein